MNTQSETMLLRDPDIEPSQQVLENVLGKDVFDVYTELLNIATSELGLEYDWKYYKDGKAWLCKVSSKKRTIFWLSIWEKFIKTGFYFTDKTASNVFDLPIDAHIKDDFRQAKPIGKLIPLTFDLDRKEQLINFREIAEYKKNQK